MSAVLESLPESGPSYELGPVRYSAITPTNGISVALSRDVRKCVVFLGEQVQEGLSHIKPYGTGFLLRGGKKVLSGGAYLVTAKHVAKQLDPPFVIRLNKKGGGAELYEIKRPSDIRWTFHPDDSVDLAATPFEVPDWADVTYFSADHVLRPEKMESKRIDAGDAAYVVGLFHLLHGTEENRPIVHTGHIAMLPEDEKIPVSDKEVEGYLVQANAISGCSGSPVFAQRSLSVLVPPQMLRGSIHKDATPVAGEIPGSIWLLGVWSSSWKVQGSQIVSVRNDADNVAGGAAPLGMGVVVPASKLIELLEDAELADARAAALRPKSRAAEATLDSLKIAGDQILKTMLNTPPQPKKEK